MSSDRDIWDQWAKVYELRMRDAWGQNRIHVATQKLTPEQISIGDWVMYLPLEITEGADMPPQMSRVVIKQWTPADICQLTTEHGLIQLRRQDTIEVVS